MKSSKVWPSAASVRDSFEWVFLFNCTAQSAPIGAFNVMRGFSYSGLVKDLDFQGDHKTASLWKSHPLSSIQRGQKEDQKNVQWWKLEFAEDQKKIFF